ncbi:MAG: type III pantothenate kinase, partial [SAR324 cluster bacterium]|nr:type III pantothenate kinase [SAR324 cluster bacterium]
MIVVAEIGNTTIHIAAFEESQMIEDWCLLTPKKTATENFELEFTQFIQSQQALFTKPQFEGWILCSVVPWLTPIFREMVRNLIGIIPIALTTLSPLPIRLIPGESPTIGIDRLIVAAAAYDLVRSGVITVDIGTATTIDAVTDQGLFLGGIILPGPKLWLNSLHAGTANLPKTEIKHKISVIQTSTTGCIQAGLYNGYRHLLEGLVQQMRLELAQKSQDDSTIYLTGGSAKYWCEDFPNWCFHPDLLMSGLA